MKEPDWTDIRKCTMYRRKQKQLEMSIKVKEGGKVGFSAVN